MNSQPHDMRHVSGSMGELTRTHTSKLLRCLPQHGHSPGESMTHLLLKQWLKGSLKGDWPMSKRIQQHHGVMPIAQLLTISQVADLLCVHRTTVYDFIKNDGLPVMKLGSRSTRVDSIKLQQWMNERTGLSA
ncbi:MAG: helix-turn-helix domain-containing protein [Chloroflexi bacterium]|nr:MAG: helix-turn-helix domain-containing protein [Chloroflexota bacterium]